MDRRGSAGIGHNKESFESALISRLDRIADVVEESGSNATVLSQLNTLIEEVRKMQNDVTELKAAVAAQTTVIGSTKTLLQKLTSLYAACNSMTEVKEVTATVRAQTAELAAANVENTPAETEDPTGSPSQTYQSDDPNAPFYMDVNDSRWQSSDPSGAYYRP